MEKHILQNEFLQLEYLADTLRIIGLTPVGKTNLFADLSSEPPIPTPYGDFHFRGGHRLWHSPEAMPRSYIPDSKVTVTNLPEGVLLESETEPSTGIRKRIEIHLASDTPIVTLTHTLINNSVWTVELAPWAITQFRLGGTVVMPLDGNKAGTGGLLPNRQLSLWAYTRLTDSRLCLLDDLLLFHAKALPPFKIGCFNPHGWLAYYVDGTLFRKTYSAQTDSIYPDNNCNSEMYCNEQFVELESLGPLTKLSPGTSVTHVETWSISNGLDSLPSKAMELLTI